MRRTLIWGGATTLALALGVGVLWALSQGDSIDAEELLARLDSPNPPLVLDVRSQLEFDSGHVPGAVHIPFLALRSDDTKVPAGRHDLVVVYCELGPRAGIAKRELEHRGFDHVVLLEGHMAGWRRADLPQEAPGRRPTRSEVNGGGDSSRSDSPP